MFVQTRQLPRRPELHDLSRKLMKYNQSPEPPEEFLSRNLLKNQVLIIESAVFKDGNQWRFSDGSMSFSAAIMDENFMRRVDAGERFRKGIPRR